MFTITSLFIGMCWTAGELEHKENLGTLHRAHKLYWSSSLEHINFLLMIN